ncbi:MAG: TRAP transporter small permease subunit [Pseudomonadales bacterium]|jgi:TRAP-type mannitol/chloroaromatic compound transport system permease small subunit|nr:TRAP transporter small permease subunit [Pseudomonadales bacterium]
MAAFDYLPQTQISRAIDPLISGLGRWVSLIWVLLLGVIVLNVLMRYVFSEGRIELEELQWHLYSIGFLLGLSYAYQADSHIRVDVIHEQLGPQVQAWIELYGIILFLLPLIALILIFSVPFVTSSYAFNEVSQSPGGLPLRWLIKAFLPLGFGFLLLAVISRLSRVWAFLFFNKTAEDQPDGR